MERVKKKDASLKEDSAFLALLKTAGDDPTMRRVQDDFFKKHFFEPAYRTAESIGIRSPLGIAVVYDSMIHGGWRRLHDMTRKELGGTPATGIDEHLWIKTYLKLRREWFKNHNNNLLQRLTYRPQAFLELIDKDNWDLLPPIEIQGQKITE